MWMHPGPTKNEMQIVLTLPLLVASGEGLHDAIDCINVIMCEASVNCLCPEYPTLLNLYVYELMEKVCQMVLMNYPKKKNSV